jgi:hypothetical protein
MVSTTAQKTPTLLHPQGKTSGIFRGSSSASPPPQGVGSGAYDPYLGAYFPNLPHGMIPIVERLYLSKSTSVQGTLFSASTAIYRSGNEGYDTAVATVTGEDPANVGAVIDTTRPYQNLIQSKVDPGRHQQVLWFKYEGGEANGSSWARLKTRGFNGTTYGTDSYRFRYLYSAHVFKWLDSMPSIGNTGKFVWHNGGFENSPGGTLNAATNSPNIFFAPQWSHTMLSTSALVSWLFNLQGTPDNGLAGVVNGVTWGSGKTDIAYTMVRDTWYMLEILTTMSSTINCGSAQRDGGVEIWITPFIDSVNNVLGTTTRLLSGSGLEIWSEPINNSGSRAYWVNLEWQPQFAGRTYTYDPTGSDTGFHAALSFIAGGTASWHNP